jgi:hypothetical protein
MCQSAIVDKFVRGVMVDCHFSQNSESLARVNGGDRLTNVCLGSDFNLVVVV